MNKLILLYVSVLALVGIGFAVGRLTSRAPASGKLALGLLAISLMGIIVQPFDSEGEIASLLGGLFFSLTAPICITYAFRVRRHAPDRIFAVAAFTGAMVMALLLAFFVAGMCIGLTEVLLKRE